jgi:hypothetical protein
MSPTAGPRAVPSPSRQNTRQAHRSHPGQVAQQVLDHNRITLRLPAIGTVTLPPAHHLGWYAGVAALAAVECIEWPIAVILAVGKALADNQHSKVLVEFGEALEEAG